MPAELIHLPCSTRKQSTGLWPQRRCTDASEMSHYPDWIAEKSIMKRPHQEEPETSENAKVEAISVVNLTWAATGSQQHHSVTWQGLWELKVKTQYKTIGVGQNVLLVVCLLLILRSESVSSLQSSLTIGCEYEILLHKHPDEIHLCVLPSITNRTCFMFEDAEKLNMNNSN